jgi:phosphatidylglycerol:prolipoprotein diacylglycerol transferase
VAFPEGLPPTLTPVHPTQLYEALPLALLTVLLVRWRRTGVADSAVVGRYLAIAGALRFGIEFVRINDRVLAGLTVAHLAALAMIVTGLALVAGSSRAATPVAPARPGRRGRR